MQSNNVLHEINLYIISTRGLDPFSKEQSICDLAVHASTIIICFHSMLVTVTFFTIFNQI